MELVRDDRHEDRHDDRHDGRHARRARNRDAVVDAMLELFREGNLRPSADEIAERAGLSPRSLFRYFDDIDDLTGAAVARQQERLRPFVELTVDRSAPLAARAAAVAEQRARLFDAIGHVGRVARLREPFHPLVAEHLTGLRRRLRQQLADAFAPELAAMGAGPAALVLAAADVVCSFEGYQLLRSDQRLGRARAVAVLTEALTRLFTQEVP